MPTELDLVIIGAGCAGLSLGIELAKLGKNAPQTLLLDRRPSYQNDRTWCFWGHDQTPFATLACHQWQQVSVQSQQQTILIDCGLTPYRQLAASDFYHYALQAIGDNQRLKHHLGIDLLEPPRFFQGKWQLVTSMGILLTKAIVDTRPLPMTALKQTRLWQSFLGVEVTCADEIFNPHQAQLMDFLPADKTGINFNYLLPLSASRALIEFTTFAAMPYSQVQLQSRLASSIEKVTQGRPYTIVRTEVGLIPMGLQTKKNTPRHGCNDGSYCYAGLTAGAARPATGYAFQRIQVWAKHCAQALRYGGKPGGHQADAFLLRQMDAIFLNVLRHHPALGPDLFMAMFSEVSPSRLIRFLSDQAQIADYFAVIKALPTAPFIKELFRRSVQP